MIISIHQPTYLPWAGYFHKIMNSDVFVILDTVQYSKNSFDNRNRIRTKEGWTWLTVPILTKGRFMGNLWPAIEIDIKQNWATKHLKSIQMNYARAKYYERYISFFEKLFGVNNKKLMELNLEIIIFFIKELGCGDKKIVRASELGVSGTKSDLVLGLCESLGADTYFSGSLGKNYLEEEQFTKKGMRIIYQHYKEISYAQTLGGFVPFLSAIDVLMNHGPESSRVICQGQENPGISAR